MLICFLACAAAESRRWSSWTGPPWSRAATTARRGSGTLSRARPRTMWPAITFSKQAGMEQRVEQFLITAMDDLLLVHDADGADNVGERPAIAFFRAPAPIDKIDCAGDKIGICCRTGAVLLLRAAWLAMTS